MTDLTEQSGTVGARLDAKIDAKFGELDAKIDAVGAKVGAVDLKLTALIAALGKTAEVQAAVEGGLDGP